jgi:hypothetical protein
VLKLSNEEAARLCPLKRPVVQKPLTITYGSAELPIFVHDSCNLRRFRAAGGAPGELIAIEGADPFTILEQLRRADGALGHGRPNARGRRALSPFPSVAWPLLLENTAYVSHLAPRRFFAKSGWEENDVGQRHF